MLTKLALGNIRRNFRNYWAYFFSSAFSAFVLYLFLSVCFGQVTRTATSFQTTALLFGIGAVLTAGFATFFIWYSNSFFLKSRKKEFATYMLLGMSKGQTVRLSVMENIAVLTMAYAVGVAAGVLLNKLMIMLLFATMQVQAPVPFEVCTMAVLISAIVFAGVIALVCIHSSFLLSRSSLIELINAAKKAEKAMKVSFGTWMIGVLAIGCLALGYCLSVFRGMQIMLWVPIVALVCGGTALAFLGLAALYLHLSRKNEATLYRGANLVTVSQLMYRYRGNVGALSTIAITTTVALCAVLCCCGLYALTQDSSRAQRPFSVEINANSAIEDTMEQVMRQHPEVKVLHKVPIQAVRVKAVGLSNNSTFQIISQSQYNAIAGALGWQDRVALANDDSAVQVLYPTVNSYDRADRQSLTIPVGDVQRELSIQKTNLRIYVSLDRFVRSLVVTDGTYAQVASTPGAQKYSLVGYVIDDDMRAGSLVTDLRAAWSGETRLLTFYEFFRESQQLFGVMMFVGVFVGLLFITATGSILYFRMTTEASEDREKFRTLIKLGIDQGQLRGAIARELAIVFGAPLVLAVVNAYMASVPLGKFVGTNMNGIFVVIVAVYALVYGLYFLLTWNKYVSTVSN